jgi:hypothetical protein
MTITIRGIDYPLPPFSDLDLLDFATCVKTLPEAGSRDERLKIQQDLGMILKDLVPSLPASLFKVDGRSALHIAELIAIANTLSDALMADPNFTGAIAPLREILSSGGLSEALDTLDRAATSFLPTVDPQSGAITNIPIPTGLEQAIDTVLSFKTEEIINYLPHADAIA